MEKNAVRDDVAYYNGESKEDIIKKMTLSIEEKILSKKGFRNFQQEVETAIFDMLLSEHYDDFGDYDKITQVTQAILELAEIHYTDME